MHPDGKAHGVSAILRCNIKHHQSQFCRKDHIEATSVVVYDWASHIIISSLYCPSRHTIYEDQIEDDVKILGNRFRARGDFNVTNTF